ncbi:DJ-1/PfpI family protein [Amycolatopsis arida]|uniref:DJ-1/PfpI family protein n=1 Tax=Amycolatopsis arida TaxID=587909 RepID=A0A1I5ZUB6_9PSEU|nr:DJ-1/PfpI family protein [Amycolatopsis arida]TDX89372.1 DJ-1/PfpI family protein [Amycolatopsis arida]SFQ60031.1 DJ-1/PfpI family protein [Amycolatopsis arida]
MTEERSKTIAFVVYPGLTLLDLAGPLQVLTPLAVAGYRVLTVGERATPHDTDTPLAITPTHTFADVPTPDVVVVPGGAAPTLRAMADERLLDYLRTASAHATVLASVCTGALLLGAAGLLDGRRATTHWVMRDQLAALGATPVAERWVEDGPVLTAAGVAAGIDMALHLVTRLEGADIARTIQFAVEYDPEPPLGPLDWSRAPHAEFGALRSAWLREGLADHPDLLARLGGDSVA